MIELNLSWDELKREELRIDIKYAKTGFDKTVGKARVKNIIFIFKFYSSYLLNLLLEMVGIQWDQNNL